MDPNYFGEQEKQGIWAYAMTVPSLSGTNNIVLVSFSDCKPLKARQKIENTDHFNPGSFILSTDT